MLETREELVTVLPEELALEAKLAVAPSFDCEIVDEGVVLNIVFWPESDEVDDDDEEEVVDSVAVLTHCPVIGSLVSEAEPPDSAKP